MSKAPTCAREYCPVEALRAAALAIEVERRAHGYKIKSTIDWRAAPCVLCGKNRPPAEAVQHGESLS